MTDATPVRRLAAAIDALQILGLTRYAWLGQPFDLPEHIRRLAPPEGLRAALTQSVKWRLYADFFTAGDPVAPRPRAVRRANGELARALSAANAGTVATEPGWRYVGPDGARLMVERLGLRLWAEPGQVVHDGPGRLETGDPVAVRVPSEAPRFSPGFYMAFSDRGLDPDRPRLLDRYYLHIRAEAAVLCVDLATTRLNAAGLPFRVKVLDDPANFERCDAAVLSLQRKDRAVALHHVRELHALLRPGLEEPVPALTLRLAPGLGFAEDPGDGASFGAHRCGVIATGLVEAHEAGLTQPGDRMELVRAHMARAGTSVETPYLGPHSAGDPRAAGDAPLERKETVPCR